MVHLILPRWRYSAGSIWYAEFQGQVGHIPERDLSDMYVFARSLARNAGPMARARRDMAQNK